MLTVCLAFRCIQVHSRVEMLGVCVCVCVCACVRVCVCVCACEHHLSGLGLGFLQSLHQLDIVQHVALGGSKLSQQRVFKILQQFLVDTVHKVFINILTLSF